MGLPVSMLLSGLLLGTTAMAASAAEPKQPAAGPGTPQTIEAAADDPWLERVLTGRAWPKAFLRAQVVRKGSRRFLVVDGQDMKTRKRFRLELAVPAGDSESRPAPEGKFTIAKPAAVSPDGRYQAAAEAGEQIVLRLTDRMKEKERIILRQAYEGDWSIGSVAWSPHGDAFYFDNAGAVACIWRYDIASGKLSKIVPAHEAFSPAPLVLPGVEWLGFIESPWEKTAYAKIARALTPEQKAALARGRKTLEPLAGIWLELERRGQKWVIQQRCGGNFHSMRILLGKGRPQLAFGPPDDETHLALDAALTTGEDTYALVARTAAGGLRELAELRFLDPQHHRLQVTRFAGRRDRDRYIAASHRDEVETLECELIEENYEELHMD